MGKEGILWGAGIITTLMLAITVINKIQKERVQGQFIKITDDVSDDLYATIVVKEQGQEKEIYVYKSHLSKIRQGQFVSFIKRKFQSIYSLNWIIGEE